MAPSAMDMARSISPPKSACPGVSMMFIFTPLHFIEQFFAAIVMPLSRPRSGLSLSLSSEACPSLNTPIWRNIASTSVVFP